MFDDENKNNGSKDADFEILDDGLGNEDGLSDRDNIFRGYVDEDGNRKGTTFKIYTNPLQGFEFRASPMRQALLYIYPLILYIVYSVAFKHGLEGFLDYFFRLIFSVFMLVVFYPISIIAIISNSDRKINFISRIMYYINMFSMLVGVVMLVMIILMIF